MKPILQVMCLTVVAMVLFSILCSFYTTVPTIYDLAFMIIGILLACVIVIIVINDE